MLLGRPGGPSVGPPGEEFGLKVCWWSSGWTTGQRGLIPSGPTPLTVSAGWGRRGCFSVPPSHGFCRVVPLRSPFGPTLSSTWQGGPGEISFGFVLSADWQNKGTCIRQTELSQTSTGRRAQLIPPTALSLVGPSPSRGRGRPRSAGCKYLYSASHRTVNGSGFAFSDICSNQTFLIVVVCFNWFKSP